MGDRCYAEINVRASDAKLWEDLGYGEEFDSESLDGLTIQLVDTERNYGVSEGIDDLVPNSPMYGWHDAGGNYTGGVFAWDGEHFASCMAVNGQPVVRWLEDTPEAGDVEEAQDYFKVLEKVLAMLDASPEQEKEVNDAT